MRFNFEYSPFRTRDEGVLVVHLVLSVSELVLERHRACVILEEPTELGNARCSVWFRTLTLGLTCIRGRKFWRSEMFWEIFLGNSSNISTFLVCVFGY